MSFGRKKLDLLLSSLKENERYVFAYLSAGLEYSYQLKLFPLFQEFLEEEKKKAYAKISELEFSRSSAGFINNLSEEQKNFVWITALDRRLQNKTFSESLIFTWYMGLSNERRLKLGVSSGILDYLGYMDTLLDRPEEHYQYQMKLKEKLSKNKLKSWQELSGFVRRNSARTPLHVFDYEQDWQAMLPLNGASFFYNNEKYLIYFPKTNHEMMDYGARFNTCLASCQVHTFLKGQEVKVLVFKEKELFSSLTLTKEEELIAVTMMRSYNNSLIDSEIWVLVQDKVNKLLLKEELDFLLA